MSKILIVDDEPAIVELLEDHLQSEGYDTEHAFSGEEALVVLEKSTPDLVILDLMLPGMDGYEVCRLMQADSRLNHIPVIMLTARSAVPNRVLGYQRGADDYIVKPFDPDELSVRVRAQLHHLYHDTVSELTGLPGTEVVEQKIAEITTGASGPWAIVYFNVANFSAYNDSYSYIEGDEMLHVAGRALKQALERAGRPGDFLGHIGGDKFVVITAPDRVQPVAQVASQIFTEGTHDFYTPSDRVQGHMVIVDRQGALTHAPLCTLEYDAVTSKDPLGA
jgi:diguanylate cyclase (GGDEF)-like protein